MTRLALALGLILLLAPAAGVARDQAKVVQREASIFYYPWYGNLKWDGAYVHWDQNGHLPPTDLATSYYPARGAYSSRDPRVVEAQMREIARAGIREVVSSWWGMGSPEDELLPMIVRMATKQGLQVAVQIEPYDDRIAASVAADLTHLRQLGITRAYVYHPFEIAESAGPPGSRSTGWQVFGRTATLAQRQARHSTALSPSTAALSVPAPSGLFGPRANKPGSFCAPSFGPAYAALRETGEVRS